MLGASQCPIHSSCTHLINPHHFGPYGRFEIQLILYQIPWARTHIFQCSEVRTNASDSFQVGRSCSIRVGKLDGKSPRHKFCIRTMFCTTCIIKSCNTLPPYLHIILLEKLAVIDGRIARNVCRAVYVSGRTTHFLALISNLNWKQGTYQVVN